METAYILCHIEENTITLDYRIEDTCRLLINSEKLRRVELILACRLLIIRQKFPPSLVLWRVDF